MGLTYRDAGVDIDAGEELVRRIGPLAAATRRPGVLSGLGGFGGLFSLEPEIIVAIPSALAKVIISNRGWVFPLPPTMLGKVSKTS